MSEQPNRLTIGIVGLGKIARDQHVPAIEQSDELTLLGTADPAGGLPAITSYPDIEALLGAAEIPHAVAICTPPQMRFSIARVAIAHGRHVLLEKPPGTTVGEVESLRELAAASGRTLFCAWHSQFAAAVQPAREWLASRRIRNVRIDWCEDVRVWHPGQTWIWEPGGFGVFDPGINALSVAARILPRPLFLKSATLHVPENCQAPIAAALELSDADDTEIRARFDFLQSGPPTWEIAIETDSGELLLSSAGARLVLNGQEVALGGLAEYPSLYARFAELVRAGKSDVDLVPLRIVADATMCGRRLAAPAFRDPAAV